jgi:hypothetical protein
MRSTTHPRGTPRRGGGALFGGVTALVLAVLALTPDGAPFSDSVLLCERVERLAPHYNAAYVPLAGAFHALAGGLFGLEVERSLAWFSRLCAALAAGVVAAGRRRAGRGPTAAALAGLLVGLSPGIWFFAIAAEVHALQLLGAALALEAAERARTRPPLAAAGWVLAGSVGAVATHLTSVLLVPLLLWRASGGTPGHAGAEHPGPAGGGAGHSGAGRGLPRRLVLALGAAGLALGVALAVLPPGPLAAWPPAQGLVTFVGLFRDRIAAGRLFGPEAAAGYLWDEWIARAGLLWAATALALLDGRTRRAALEVLVASLPFALVFSQGGVRESGAYFVALYPPMAAVAAHLFEVRTERLAPRPVAVLAAALAALQAAAALPTVSGLVRGRDLARWARVVEAGCPPGSVVATSDLPQWHTLALAEGDYLAQDLRYALEITPPRFREAVAEERLGVLGAFLAQDRRVFLDAALVEGADPLGVWAPLRERLRTAPVELLPLGEEGRVELFEVVARTR